MRRSLWRNFDWRLLGIVLVLGSFGVVMIASALSGNVVLAAYPWRQLGFFVIGLALLFVSASIDYRLLASVATPAHLILLALMLVISVAGTISGGAQRWLAVGEFFLQPSELIKVAIILQLARYLADNETRMDRLGTPIGAILIVIPAVVLIYLQPNLSTAISILVIAAAMLFVGGLRWRHALLLVTVLGAALLPIWQFVLDDYMKGRVLSFIGSSAAADMDTYNIDQAMISIGSGGWLGRGLFRGTQSQLHFLRVRHTDFIFSVIAEELGFFGALALIALLAWLLWRLLRIAGLARDTFGRLIVAGVVVMILFQTIINIGMNLRLLPVTGIPLPLISYGGSSLWSVLIGVGLAQSVAMRWRKIEFE